MKTSQKGERRVDELANAVKLYDGIEHACVDKLKDGPYVWPREKVADVVRSEMIKFKPTCIVTFDEKGVSGLSLLSYFEYLKNSHKS